MKEKNKKNVVDAAVELRCTLYLLVVVPNSEETLPVHTEISKWRVTPR